jgi:hypothetical protein
VSELSNSNNQKSNAKCFIKLQFRVVFNQNVVEAHLGQVLAPYLTYDYSGLRSHDINL